MRSRGRSSESRSQVGPLCAAGSGKQPRCFLSPTVTLGGRAALATCWMASHPPAGCLMDVRGAVGGVWVGTSAFRLECDLLLAPRPASLIITCIPSPPRRKHALNPLLLQHSRACESPGGLLKPQQAQESERLLRSLGGCCCRSGDNTLHSQALHLP